MERSVEDDEVERARINARFDMFISLGSLILNEAVSHEQLLDWIDRIGVQRIESTGWTTECSPHSSRAAIARRAIEQDADWDTDSILERPVVGDEWPGPFHRFGWFRADVKEFQAGKFPVVKRSPKGQSADSKLIGALLSVLVPEEGRPVAKFTQYSTHKDLANYLESLVPPGHGFAYSTLADKFKFAQQDFNAIRKN